MFLPLRCGRHRVLLAVVQRFVDFSAYPQVMQQNCEFARGRNDGSLLSVLSTALGQLQAPAPQITVHTERAQNMLCPLHQQGSQIRIAFLVILGPAARETL